MVLEHNLSLVNKVNRLLSWGHWFTFFNILLALVITASYWLAEPLPQTITGWSYLLSNWLGHTAFLCFLFFILTIFPLSLLFPSQKHVRGLGAVLATLALVLLIFDAYVYSSLGYHIGNTSWQQTLELMRSQIVTNLRNFILIVSVTAAGLLAFQLTLSNFCWKKVGRLQAIGIGRPIWVFFVGCFTLSHLIHIWADAQLNIDVVRQDNVLPLSYPATAKSFLARHRLLDRQERASSQQQQLDALDYLKPVPVQLNCPTAASAEKALTIVIMPSLSPTDKQHLNALGLRQLAPHFAPTQTNEALGQLLFGQFVAAPHVDALLTEPPFWLQQAPELFGIEVAADFPAGPAWLHQFSRPEAPVQLRFLTQVSTLSLPSGPLLLLELTASHSYWKMAPVAAWYRWPELRQQPQPAATLHLDLLPTLLAYAGCNTTPGLAGDNLLAPRNLPKLAISQHEIYSFYKDKLVIIREDNSFGIWSAATGLPLNERFDMPMLVDALQRLPALSNE
ncbi:DUF3413 domain-containing protein [Alkalimonas sp. MEB108]|uniref:DUF3413 domain-containing protein n=1 Tax=Alkalimonas cellulosilytica TaxID=3058395 RepID=A0ABU7J4V4_9GAMM|nr:DUF3413 domain-containing protein [Alkalimonas sp. MEB108]MEE2001305.1 DUF3413 domain-containing protein [Alkalimonas sp. MEB108]